MKKATSISQMYEFVIAGLAKAKTFNCHQAIVFLNGAMHPTGIDLTPTEYNCSYKTRFDEKVANLFKNSQVGGNILVNCGLISLNSEHSLMTITKAGMKTYLYKNKELIAKLHVGDYKGVAELVSAFK